MTIQDIVNSLAKSYSFRDQEAVSHYLDIRPFLVPLIWEVDVRTRQYFDVGSPLILEVVKEYESGPEEGHELFGMIPTRLSPEEPRRRLRRLDEDWWLQASHQGHHQKSINIRYI